MGFSTLPFLYVLFSPLYSIVFMIFFRYFDFRRHHETFLVDVTIWTSVSWSPFSLCMFSSYCSYFFPITMSNMFVVFLFFPLLKYGYVKCWIYLTCLRICQCLMFSSNLIFFLTIGLVRSKIMVLTWWPICWKVFL